MLVFECVFYMLTTSLVRF